MRALTSKLHAKRQSGGKSQNNTVCRFLLRAAFHFTSLIVFSIDSLEPLHSCTVWRARAHTHTHAHDSGLCVLAAAPVLWVIWSNVAEVVPTRLSARGEQTGTNDLHTRITQRPYVPARCRRSALPACAPAPFLLARRSVNRCGEKKRGFI